MSTGEDGQSTSAGGHGRCAAAAQAALGMGKVQCLRKVFQWRCVLRETKRECLSPKVAVSAVPWPVKSWGLLALCLVQLVGALNVAERLRAIKLGFTSFGQICIDN